VGTAVAGTAGMSFGSDPVHLALSAAVGTRLAGCATVDRSRRLWSCSSRVLFRSEILASSRRLRISGASIVFLKGRLVWGTSRGISGFFFPGSTTTRGNPGFFFPPSLMLSMSRIFFFFMKGYETLPHRR